MFRRSTALVAILAFLLAGCSAAGAAMPATPTSTIAPTPTPTPTPEPTPVGFVQSYEQCKAVVQAQLDVIADISTRLNTAAGINIKDYGPLVDTIPVTDMTRLAGGTNRYCRNTVVQDAASTAIDYDEASSGWSNCLSFPTSEQQPCIDKIVQAWWAKATNDYTKTTMDLTSLQQAFIPPLDPNPIYDQESPKPSYTPVEVASMACDRQYGPALADIFELGRALAETTTLTDYGLWIKATSDDLAKVDTSGLDGTCLISVGATVRTILNDHVDARNAWQACTKQKTQAKWDACVAKTVQPIWGGRTTTDYTNLFDAMGTLYLDQVVLLRPAWLPHATP